MTRPQIGPQVYLERVYHRSFVSASPCDGRLCQPVAGSLGMSFLEYYRNAKSLYNSKRDEEK